MLEGNAEIFIDQNDKLHFIKKMKVYFYKIYELIIKYI